MKRTPDNSPVRAVRWTGRQAVVEVHGDVDVGLSAQFQQALLDVLNGRPQRVVVDLAAVPYMDSSGVASLVKLLSRARRQGAEVRLAALTDHVRGIFEITRLETVFDIRTTVEEAMR